MKNKIKDTSNWRQDSLKRIARNFSDFVFDSVGDDSIWDSEKYKTDEEFLRFALEVFLEMHEMSDEEDL
jgi:hypothetical protein